MQVIEQTRLTEAFREAILKALDDTAAELFRGAPTMGRDPGATDSDLPALFAAIDSHALKLAERYGVQVDDGEEEPGPAMKWGAGWTMPGYMPDSEPAHFATWEEARDYLASEIERATENQTEEESTKEELEGSAAIESLNALADGEEFGRTVGGYHYWISAL